MCLLSVCSVAHFIYVSPVGGLAIYCMAWSTPFLVSLTIMFTCIIVQLQYCTYNFVDAPGLSYSICSGLTQLSPVQLL